MPDTRRTFLSKLALATGALTLPRFLPAQAVTVKTAAPRKWASGMALDITFSVATQAGGRVKRPYVAVWIEDGQGKAVRTLTVWAQTTGRGPRWIPELRRWYRQSGPLLQTVSSATRNPGTYAVAWDGKTDQGALAGQGSYFVCIETAREHGPYSLVREAVTLGAATFKKDLTPDGDIETARVQFGQA